MSGREPLQTELTVGFDDGSGASPPISIEGDPGIGYRMGDDVNVIHLLVFCPVIPQVHASVGTVRLGNYYTFPVPSGILTFGGGTSSSLPKAPASSPTFKTLFAFDLKGVPTGISVHYDPKTYSVVADKPCHAAVSYTAYKAIATEVKYTPRMEAIGEGNLGGVSVTYGMIAAFAKPSSMITYQVQPATGPDAVDIEIYRIVSDALTNDEGQLEFPPEYPKNGIYPSMQFEADITKCLQIERVHEIGTLTPTGYVGVRTFTVPICKPYVGIHNYKPKTRLVEAPLPKGMSSSDMAKAKSKIAELGYGNPSSYGKL